MDSSETARALPPLGTLFRHQFRLIIASVVLLLGLAALYVFNLPSTYTATAVVLLSPAPGSPLTPEAASGSAVQMTVALETEAQLLRTPAVADVVEANVGREIPASGEILSVSVPSNTQMLEVSFTSDSPERAQEGAESFAEGYLEYRDGRAKSLQETRIERLREQIEEADANLRRAISESSGDESSGYASQEVQLFVDRLAQLNNSLSAAESVSVFPGSVISAAEQPKNSNELPGWLILSAATVIGLGVGLVLALIREWRRDLLDSFRGASVLGVPMVGTIRPAGDDALVSDSDLVVHELYRQLRTAVIARCPKPHVLAVTEVLSDVHGAHGRVSTDVATNLAVVLAEARFSVLMVAAATEESRIKTLLGIESGPSLDEALTDDSASDRLPSARGVSVLFAGGDVESPLDLTATTAFREVVHNLRLRYDYVILAASSAGSADGGATMLAADSALLVLAPGEITQTLLSATLDRLNQLGVEIMGTVMIDKAAPSNPAPRAASERQRAKRDNAGGRG